MPLASEASLILPPVHSRPIHLLGPEGRFLLSPGGHIALVTEARELAPVVEGFLDA